MVGGRRNNGDGWEMGEIMGGEGELEEIGERVLEERD